MPTIRGYEVELESYEPDTHKAVLRGQETADDEWFAIISIDGVNVQVVVNPPTTLEADVLTVLGALDQAQWDAWAARAQQERDMGLEAEVPEPWPRKRMDETRIPFNEMVILEVIRSAAGWTPQQLVGEVKAARNAVAARRFP